MGMLAQTTAGDMFVNAPNSIMPLLQRNTRLDMIDYFKSSLPNTSANIMQGRAKITALSSSNVEFDMSDASSYQLSLLPAGKDTIAVLIETLRTPIPDSHIRFFSRRWEKMNRTCMDEPKLKDWLTIAGKTHQDSLERVLPFILVAYHYDATTQILTLTQQMASYFRSEEYSGIANMLKPRLMYRWNGKRMVAIADK
jgi:hypothetical protein